jgi:hypothetical protein
MPHAEADERASASIQAEFSRSAAHEALNMVFRVGADGRVVAAFPAGVEIVFPCGPRELAERLHALADSTAETLPAPAEAQ